ncbi:MAG TPA: response regulator [Acidobacteriaceae bacterium]|jgi:CheY-like chemotaxis protein|nr:response regulator [Acidobacteriaceae bacterium]
MGEAILSRFPRRGSAWRPFLTKSGNKPKVLIADDEPIIADTLQLILAQNGFEATAVYDGRRAVDRALRWRPDIFLTDIFMPALNGIEAAVLIVTRVPKCHILLLSGHADSPDLWHEAYVQGYDFPILQKPVPPEALIAHLWETVLEDSREAS